MPERIIFHVDMDAFFAAVAQNDNPDLRHKPVAVIGSGRRTVVLTASYEARAYGVKTGMTVFAAKKACPKIIFCLARHSRYAAICCQVYDVLYTFTPEVEINSIDEFFMDMAGSLHLFGTVLETAARIKKMIVDVTGLTASIGIGPNKLLAKLAGDLKKPDGIFWIKESQVSEIIGPLNVEKLWGIGPATKQRLNSIGITSIGELRGLGIEQLRRMFGVCGERLHQMAQGLDDAAVIPLGNEAAPKSISHSQTLDEDIADISVLKQHILDLSDRVGRRLRKADLQAGCVGLTLRYADFKTFTRQKALITATQDTRLIYRLAGDILEGIKLRQPVRLLGIGLSRLSPADKFFLLNEDRRRFCLNQALDKINQGRHKGKVTYASLQFPHPGRP